MNILVINTSLVSSSSTSSPLYLAAIAAITTIPYYAIYRRLIYIGKAAVEEACKQVGIYLTGKDNTFYKGYVIGKMTNIIGKEAPI